METLFCDKYRVDKHQKNCKLKSKCNIKKCGEFCPRCYTFTYLLENSNIGQSYLKGVKLIPAEIDVKAFDRLAEIRENILNYVENGNNLLILSKRCGNGKTTWAIKLLLNYFAEISGVGFGADGLFISVSDLISQYKNSIGTNSINVLELEKRILEVNLLVLDDIGTTLYSDYDMEKLYKLVNHRLNAGLSTIYTTNMTTGALKENLGNRLYSRVAGSEHVEFRGLDNRLEGTKC